MTLHIYREAAEKPVLLMGLEYDCLKALEPAFQRFKGSTGVELSEYDDAELGPQHLALLAGILKALSTPPAAVAAEYRRFQAAIEESAKAGHTLTFVGE